MLNKREPDRPVGVRRGFFRKLDDERGDKAVPHRECFGNPARRRGFSKKSRQDPGNEYVQVLFAKKSCRVTAVCRSILERYQETLLARHVGMMAETNIEQV